MIFQKIKNISKDDIELISKYYYIIAYVNNIHLTKREVELITFTNIKGNISYKENREEFCSLYGTSSATVYNMISKLKRMKILVNDKDKVKVHPSINLDFKKGISLSIQLDYEKA